jgi:transposase
MKKIRKKYTPEFKHKVALRSLQGDMTLAELSQHFKVNSGSIYQWSMILKKDSLSLFQERLKKSSRKNKSRNNNISCAIKGVDPSVITNNCTIGDLIIEQRENENKSPKESEKKPLSEEIKKEASMNKIHNNNGIIKKCINFFRRKL